MGLIDIITLLIGLLLIAMGGRSILKREAKFGWGGGDDHDDSHRIVEGLPAILVGALEVAVGLYFVIYHRSPFPLFGG